MYNLRIKNFGFITFVDVPDVRELEKKLNGAIYRNNSLEINVERHKTKDPPNITLPLRKSFPTIPNDTTGSTWNAGGGFRDERSFDEVTRHKSRPSSSLQAPPPPIQLEDDDSMD